MDIAGDADRDDIAAWSALASYDFGSVLSVDRLPTGGRAVRKVTTSVGAYVLKPGWRRADVALLAELPALAQHGICQPAIIRTAAGELVGPDGYFLQEFLACQPELELSDAQVRAIMRAVGELHLALGRLRLSAGYEPDQDSVFVQVTDLGYLLGELPGLLRHYELLNPLAETAIGYLAEYQAALGAQPRHLVHGDIGPDNVLLDGEKVVAIIDFTPHLLPALFAAATALYWFHVHGHQQVLAADLTASWAAIAQARPWTPAGDELWLAGLTWESLRRFATTLELARRGRTDPGPAASARIAAVKAIATLIRADALTR
jgi:Ser/Thr protein kinase RdoA (MazF antagonist)